MNAVPNAPVISREALIHALYEAAELEHNLMCTYLYAAFSLKSGTEEGLSAAEAEASFAVRFWRVATPARRGPRPRLDVDAVVGAAIELADEQGLDALSMRDFRPTDAAPSVHLASFPVADAALIDPELSSRMAVVRRLVELGRAARAESGMKVRQPLSRALASAPGFASLGPELLAEIAAELNVGTVEALAGSFVDTTAKANFRTLGKRLGNND